MPGVSGTYDSADNQCNLTAKINTATVATRNSGPATMASVAVLRTRSRREPGYMADRIPIVSAIGTQTAAAAPASQSDFGKRSAMSSATGLLLASDWPGLPVNNPPSQCR